MDDFPQDPETEIKSLLRKFGVPAGLPIFETDKLEGLGLNVIARIQLIEQLEKTFQCTITAGEERQIKTVGDVIRIIKSKL